MPKMETSTFAPVRHTCIEVLVAIARHHGLDLSVDQVVHAHALKKEPTPQLLVRIAEEAGIEARHVCLGFGKLKRLGQSFPILGILKDGRAIVIKGLDDHGNAIVLNPLNPTFADEIFDETLFRTIWGGNLILLKRRFTSADHDRPFGLWWFVEESWKQKRAFRDVILAALALNLIALLIPLYFQIIVDKVLVHRTFSTLQVLTVGVGLAVVFEALLSFLRSYVLMHAVRKIDIRVATHTFQHLLSLPSYFFNRATAGVLTKHMQQSERIREFLTGQSLATLLDVSVLFVFLPFLLSYSVRLTLVVLGFTGAIAIVIGVLLVPFRKALQELYDAEGKRQALLVESIHGIGTIKSLAIEPQQREIWNSFSAQTVQRTFSVGKISLWARTLSHMLEQLMTVAIIALGVFLVFDHSLTVGELIAFQMLSNRVSAPLVHFVALIHQYQETGIAIRMLGQIMNAKGERPSASRTSDVDMHGDIQFESITFTYPEAPAPACIDVTLHVPGGTTLGIVGHSGSGKTTLARLIQALYPVQIGFLRIGGKDLREIDLAHLRSNIGVVPQDSILFRGTVRENIARAKPDATFAEIENAARLAGAYEFIERLTYRFDTTLEEGAVNLSGGERQRLAIARALLRNPPILVFDEATSALDPESEEIVKKNLKSIGAGRTMIMISHRLSMVRRADKIVVMERGRIIGEGTHEQLVGEEGERKTCPVYQNLWRRQMNPDI